MKARVKSSGEIREVYEKSITHWYDAVTDEYYYPFEIELLPDTREEVTIEGWVAVDTSYGGLPHLHTGKPHLEKLVYDDYGCFDMVWECDGDKYMLDPQLFLDMTPESEPKKYRITITPIEE